MSQTPNWPTSTGAESVQPSSGVVPSGQLCVPSGTVTVMLVAPAVTSAVPGLASEASQSQTLGSLR